MKRFFIDSEFVDTGGWIIPISLGIIAESGETYYAEFSNFNPMNAPEWIVYNVFPHLQSLEWLPGGIGFRWGPAAKDRKQIADEVIAYFEQWDLLTAEETEIWGYYSSYDWVLFCQLFGPMIELPKKFPRFCRDLKQLLMERGNPKIPGQSRQQHHALNDAAWVRDSYLYLQTRKDNPEQ